MTLEAPWRIQRVDEQHHQFYYTNTQTRQSIWIRPTPPPGYHGRWPILYRASHILVKFYDRKKPPEKNRSNNKMKGYAPITRTKDEAHQKVANILATLREHPERFAQIAQKESDCSSSQRSGDLGWADLGMMYPEFEEAALKLPYGHMSDIVQSPSGFHIILRTGFYQKTGSDPPFSMEYQIPEEYSVPDELKTQVYRTFYAIEQTPTHFDGWRNAFDLMNQI